MMDLLKFVGTLMLVPFIFLGCLAAAAVLVSVAMLPFSIVIMSLLYGSFREAMLQEFHIDVLGWSEKRLINDRYKSFYGDRYYDRSVVSSDSPVVHAPRNRRRAVSNPTRAAQVPASPGEVRGISKGYEPEGQGRGRSSRVPPRAQVLIFPTKKDEETSE